MAVLFISHSSKDDGLASSLEAWLNANGFTDIFVDHQSIAGGEKWREALRSSAGACRVVLCLVTENWLASSECFSEYRAAWYMGKRIVPLFLVADPKSLDEQATQRFNEVRAEDQGLDLKSCLKPDRILDIDADQDIASRLRTGLRASGALSRVGLDPEAFEIDRTLRPMPFPGLSSFGDEDADAALFYGRSREIAHTLEELRKMRAERDLRPLVVLGASGAGKSSLLKAGIIPRLRREAPAWLPLRAFRPGADPLLNFSEAISKTLADFKKQEAHGTIRDRLLDVWTKAERDAKRELTDVGSGSIAVALEAEGNKLREAAGRPAASILISVDQAEEMARADGSSGEALADYLRVALAMTSSSCQLAFTIRTDSFPELQSHRRFQNLEARGYDLRAVPVYYFENVVVEPAKRYGVTIEDALIDALMQDAPKEDALPLLAFALQRLWRRYAASGALTKENYDKVGGLRGLIEDAAERALRGMEPELDESVPTADPPKRLVDLAASTFVPTLVQLNEHGAPIRRQVEWASLTRERHELLGRFIRWQLVISKASAKDSSTIEVTHEALFREWPRVREWLEPERARLEALRSLQLAADTWGRRGQAAAFLDHRHKRLAEAVEISKDAGYARRVTPLEYDYVAACKKAEGIDLGRKRRTTALVGVLMLSIVTGLTAYWQQAEVRKFAFWATYFRGYVLTAAQEHALKPGDTFSECAKVWSDDRTDGKHISKFCPDMVVIPAGSFKVGKKESYHSEDIAKTVDSFNMAIAIDREDSRRLVTIAEPFAVSKFTVTFDQWDACVAAGGCGSDNYRPWDDGHGRGTRPVIHVHWGDAQQYVAWLSNQTGMTYRLLSEDEFGYAARAGSMTNFPWGDELGRGNANCFTCGMAKEYLLQTAPVGSFAANQFGLYDMYGNVWQWVGDCYEVAATVDLHAVKECGAHVVRGGSYQIDDLFDVRDHRPDARNGDIGFRVGRAL